MPYEGISQAAMKAVLSTMEVVLGFVTIDSCVTVSKIDNKADVSIGSGGTAGHADVLCLNGTMSHEILTCGMLPSSYP